MEIFEVFYSSILQVFETGVFGLKLFDLGVTLLIIVIAISVRGLFAKFVLNKIKKIVKPYLNKLADKDLEFFVITNNHKYHDFLPNIIEWNDIISGL